jgi:hypothetical protein
MYSNLENISSHINKLSEDDWERLFALIPEIEKTKTFIKSGGIIEDSNDPDSFIITPVIEKEIVWDLESVLNDLNLLIAFNWAKWNEGREIATKQKFENQDTITLLKLISAFIRNNRFCDGALAEKFEDRSIEKILTQIKKNIENSTKAQ